MSITISGIITFPGSDYISGCDKLRFINILFGIKELWGDTNFGFKIM